MDFVYSDGAQRGHNWESFSETVTIISITNTHIKNYSDIMLSLTYLENIYVGRVV